MEFYAVDTETHYDKKSFTLKKLSTDAYVYDPRFEVLCLSIYSPKTKVVLPQEAIAGWLQNINPAEVAFIAQHAQFDGAVLWAKYRFAPAFWIDTLSMSRAVDGLAVRHGLEAQCQRYGLPPKTVDYDAFDGKRWADLTPLERVNLGQQCLGDSERTYRIAQMMLERMTYEELRVIDLNIRMFTQPVIRGDVKKLSELVSAEKARKDALLNELGLTAKDLASDIKFENLLLSIGQEVIYKPSKTKRGFKGAFAKSDEFMQELLESDDELISTLAQLRVEVKSTIQQTRAETFLQKASRGPMCVYYRYYGARNSRFSGGGGDNFQNLPSRGKNGKALREAINPPEGFVFVVGDLAQIECRMEMAFAGQFDKLEAFRQKRDLYCELGTLLFGRTITKEDVTERQLSKTILLQSGYGSGWLKILLTAKRLFGIDMDEQTARRFLSVYRNDNLAICGIPQGNKRVNGLWQKGEDMLRALAEGWSVEYRAPAEPGHPVSPKPLFTIKEHKVTLPNGLRLHYDGLHWGTYLSPKGEERTGWFLPRYDGSIESFYGAKFIQNVNSALSRLVMTQAMLRITERAPWGRVVLHTHDDLALCVPENRAADAQTIMQEELTRPPVWLPNIPLGVEVQVRRDYAK